MISGTPAATGRAFFRHFICDYLNAGLAAPGIKASSVRMQ
jgi:hypothetical protein